MNQALVLAKCILLICVIFSSGCATYYSSNPPISESRTRYDAAPGAEPRFFKTDDQITLFGQWWFPEDRQQAKAAIILVHGTWVHSGFYSDWAEQLTANGYAVFGIDLRGWGQSQGRGRRGFALSYDKYLDDLKLAYGEVKSTYPELPIFLQGESLGGLLGLLSQIRGEMPVDGLIMNAPAVRPALTIADMETPSWLANYSLWLASFPGEIFPNHPILVPGSVTEQFIGLAVSDEKVQNRILNDQHVVHDALPLGFFTGLHETTEEVEEKLYRIKPPILVLHGINDSLIPVSSSEYLIDNVASRDRTLRVYRQMSHATLHDFGHKTVWNDIVEWLNDRVLKRPV